MQPITEKGVLRWVSKLVSNLTEINKKLIIVRAVQSF
jgi:hypothetical protein